MNKNFENLTRHIPYYASSGNVVLLDDGTVFTGLCVTGLDTVSMTPNQLSSTKGKFKSVFDTLPSGFVVQIFHDYGAVETDVAEQVRMALKSEHPTAKSFQDSYVRNLATQVDVRQVSVYLFLIWPSKKMGGGVADLAQRIIQQVSLFKFRTTKTTKEEKLKGTFKSRVQEILNHTQRVQYALTNLLAVDSTMMAREKLNRLVFKLLNPDMTAPTAKKPYAEEVHDCPARSLMTLREELTHSVIEEHADYLKIGEKYVSALTLRTPSQFTQEYHSEIILNSLDFPFCWSFGFRIMDTSGVNAKLEAKQRRKHAFVVSSDNPSISSTISKGEIEEALTDQKTNGFNWYEVSLSFLIYADDTEELKDRVTRLVSVFRDFQESILIVEKSAQMKAFLSSLPGLAYRNNRHFLFSSLNVSDLAPISEPPRGTKDLSCYFQTHRGTLFRFSTFSNEFNNWNQVVVGKIGSGKSFIVNNILNLALMNMDKPRVMILDLGQSFKRTTQLWGGEYITIDLDHPDSGLNPLPPRDLFLDKDESVLGLLDFTVNLLLLMAELGSEKRFHARILKRALLKTYERVRGRNPIMTDLHETLDKPADYVSDEQDKNIAIELAKLLEDYVGDGAYARLFNRESTLSHRSDFFCFDFKNANQSPHIREIATYIVGGYICRKMVENPFPKFIVFDEFSTTLKHETGAALCEMIAKNCRKHGVSFIAISQQVDDFLKHKSSETLYKQANFKWFLRMDDDLGEVKETLKVNDTDIRIIQELETIKGEYAEVYLVYGNKKGLIRLSPDPLTYWACTTDARDKRLLEAYSYRLIESSAPLEKAEQMKLGFPGDDKSHDQQLCRKYSLLEILQTLARLYPKGVDSDVLEKDPFYKCYLSRSTERFHEQAVEPTPIKKRHKNKLKQTEEVAHA